MWAYPERIDDVLDPKDDEIKMLKRALAEAQREIDHLRKALGSNHPLGVRHGIFG